jgi:class 3 adenylate cyclase/DNA-binding response OmpR family regulator/predicted ATPase
MDVRARVACALQASRYTVELASDVKRALKLATVGNFQVAIVAPGPSPESLASMLELRDSAPHMIVLAEDTDQITCWHRSFPELETFLLKSSNEGALLAFVNEKIAHADPVFGSSILHIGDCTLDLAGHVFVDADGGEIALTRAETQLLKTLARSPCGVRSRDELRNALAGRSADPFDRSIDMIVARLRRKIEPDPKHPRFLITVQGVGYKLVARPASTDDEGQSKLQSTEPERRQISALCCKFLGAMELAVKLDPEDLSKITRSFQTEIAATIARMGGTIAAVTPDEILAFFGYPKAREDDAERAVDAALDAVAKTTQLPSPTGTSLQAGVGIATGLVLASSTQAVGEPLAVAAALCDLSAPNSVLIAATTRRLLGNDFVCDEPERLVLGVVSNAVSVCRVIGKQTHQSRFIAQSSNKISRFIGRDEEIRQLLALSDRADRGHGQVGLICGEPGIGKSHLCEFLLHHKLKGAHATIRYQCSPNHLTSPFYPIIRQLENSFGFDEADTLEIKFEKLATALSQSLNSTRDDIALYADLLSIAAGKRASLQGLTPQRRKDLTIDVLIRHLLSFAEKQLLVIVLADAHWVDTSTLEFVNRLIPLIATTRVLFLIKFRPEFSPQWLAMPHVSLLELDRMSRGQSLDIVSAVAGEENLPQEIREHIIDKADGVPLFIEELTKAVLESGFERPRVVPVTLLNSLTARLDRLGPAKEVAQIGAVIGREFSERLLMAVAAEETPFLQTALRRLAASELIAVNGEFPDVRYRFKHALVQDAAYATLSRVKRQQLHKLVADVLEKEFSLTIESQPELLAHHFAQAGLTERAIDYLQKAALRSLEHSANAEAIEQLTSALKLLQSVPDSAQRKSVMLQLEVMLAQAMIASYGYAAPRTRDTFQRAKVLIDGSTELSQKFAVLYGLWACHYVAGEVAQQREAAANFLVEAERANDAITLCVAHRLVGTTLLTMGEFPAALRHLNQARTLYRSAPSPSGRYQYGQDVEAAVLCYLSWALWHVGRVDQAQKIATEAIELAEKLSHPHTLVYTICHARGFMDLFRGRYEDMQSYAGLVISICKQNGFSHWLNCGTIFDGWAAVCAGEVARGEEVLREGVAGWQKKGAQLWMPMFLILEAETYAKAGRDETALQTIEQALTICNANGECWAIAEILRTKARLLQSMGRANCREIETMLLEALAVARRQKALSWEMRISCDLSRLWQRQGQDKKALKLLRSVYDQFTEGFDSADLRDAQQLIHNLNRRLHKKSTEASRKVSAPNRRMQRREGLSKSSVL